ncbi:hypothetical protein M430DRAFT_214397 [Amorphotheca resinae ATCC 22711]|uniref:Uncharacterized protein n=1 Tax=Amorphotheca resinae ATCC 22711 TaxID=857342 RepID=A0A2T3B8H5_AMORE|nr:hypothetical protein M430DRAFT_214397 [Amorphotheca resinae ATCC 22711]PSS23188.1 hypothetical protein M430DRAFT_214397 [Amorphotheca resinae ATCC 22711]
MASLARFVPAPEKSTPITYWQRSPTAAILASPFSPYKVAASPERWRRGVCGALCAGPGMPPRPPLQNLGGWGSFVLFGT